MLWRCECCGAEFTEPYRYRYRENLDGENGIQDCCELLCPECGEEDITEVFEMEDEDVDL